MGASRRARRSMERKRIAAARREYRRRGRMEAEDAQVLLDVEDFTPEWESPVEPIDSERILDIARQEGALGEESPALPEPVAAFRRITGQ